MNKQNPKNPVHKQAAPCVPSSNRNTLISDSSLTQLCISSSIVVPSHPFASVHGLQVLCRLLSSFLRWKQLSLFAGSPVFEVPLEIAGGGRPLQMGSTFYKGDAIGKASKECKSFFKKKSSFSKQSGCYNLKKTGYICSHQM